MGLTRHLSVCIDQTLKTKALIGLRETLKTSRTKAFTKVRNRTTSIMALFLRLFKA